MKVNLSRRKTIPATDRGVKVNYGESRRKGYRWQRYFIAFVIIAPLAFIFGHLASTTLSIDAVGQVNLKEEQILAPANGRFTPSVREKDKVQPGQELGMLVVDPLPGNSEKLLKASKALEQNEAAAMLAGRLIIAREQEGQAASELKTYSDLFRKGAATRAELNQVRERYEIARQQRILLDAQQQGMGFARVDWVDKPDDEPVKMTLHTTQGGIVEESTQGTEAWVTQGALLLRITNPDLAPRLSVFLKPKDIAHIHDGDKVTLIFPDGQRIPGYVDMSLMTPVKRSWQQAENDVQQSTLLMRAEIRLDQPLPLPLRTNGLPFTVDFGWTFLNF